LLFQIELVPLHSGPGNPPETDVVIPGGVSPTVTPNLELVDPAAARANLTVGGGGTAACWAVLQMATATENAPVGPPCKS
jgi:hypothetical protein